jgi:hypothetical protein
VSNKKFWISRDVFYRLPGDDIQEDIQIYARSREISWNEDLNTFWKRNLIWIQRTRWGTNRGALGEPFPSKIEPFSWLNILISMEREGRFWRREVRSRARGGWRRQWTLVKGVGMERNNRRGKTGNPGVHPTLVRLVPPLVEPETPYWKFRCMAGSFDDFEN